MLAAVAWLICSSTAAARQAADVSPVVAKADFHAVIGWQNLRQGEGDNSRNSYNNWANGIFYGGAGAGWHWTDHHKTQVDFGAGTRGEHSMYRAFSINGVQATEFAFVRVQQQSLAISQQYQFYRNQWFHPRVGLGLDIARESVTRQFDPLTGYDPVLRMSRLLAPARIEGPLHRTVVRPFGEVGFKAYMTRRSFFTTDLRLMARSGIDEVLFRLGFGVDF